MTDKEFLYEVAKLFERQAMLDRPASEGTARRLRFIAHALPLAQTTLIEKEVKVDKDARKRD